MTQVAPSLMMQLKTVLKHISAGKLFVLFGIVATTMGGLVYLILWAGQPNYEYLYTNLTAEDAGAIVAQLKERHIPYKIDAGGTAIAIPKKQIYEVRLDMASQGLPESSGIGFEIFDNTKLGMTEFIQNVNYQRALQGELSRTITRFQEVESARVHIVIPPKSLFVEEEPSTASVVIKLKRGHRLNPNQVQSIVHLVSSSVARLETDHVTVVDSRGTLLAGFKKKTTDDAINSDHLEYQRRVEIDLEDRVRSMLETVVGKNKAIVRVSCALDFRKEEQTEERFLPENKVFRSEQVKNETSNGADLIPIGIPGMASNVMQRATGADISSSGPQNILRQDKTMNYEVGRVTRRQVMPVGSIQYMSVAVVVDGTYGAAGNKKGAQRTTYTPRSPEEMAQIENLVKRAINFTAERGDKVEVANIPFETETLEPIEAPENETRWTDHLGTAGTILKPVMVAVGVLLMFLFIVRPLMRWMTSTSPWDAEILQQLPKTVSELEVEYTGQSNPGSQSISTMNEVNQLIATDQDRSLQLVQGWLNEANQSAS